MYFLWRNKTFSWLLRQYDLFLNGHLSQCKARSFAEAIKGIYLPWEETEAFLSAWLAIRQETAEKFNCALSKDVIFI